MGVKGTREINIIMTKQDERILKEKQFRDRVLKLKEILVNNFKETNNKPQVTTSLDFNLLNENSLLNTLKKQIKFFQITFFNVNKNYKTGDIEYEIAIENKNYDYAKKYTIDNNLTKKVIDDFLVLIKEDFQTYLIEWRKENGNIK